MITFELDENYGVIESIKLSSGEIFTNWMQFKDYALENEVTIYGEGAHQLTIGLKGEGEKPRIWSYLRNGIASKVKYKKVNIIDLTMWNLSLKADSDSELKVQRIFDTYGAVPLSPSSVVNSSFYAAIDSVEVERMRANRPSLIDAYLSSSKLPDRNFKPAYSGGMLSNAADTHTIYDSVSSFDITSSYPYHAVACKVPVSKSVNVSEESMARLEVDPETGSLGLSEVMGFIGLFRVTDFKRKSWVRVPLLRVSDAQFVRSPRTDNIGVVSGSAEFAFSMYDLETFCMQYDFESIEIVTLSLHKLGKLPSSAVRFIKDAYLKKNALEKGDPERDAAKTALNTIVGFWGVDPFSRMAKKSLSDGVVEHDYNGSLDTAFDSYAGTEDKIGFSAGHARAWDFRWAVYALAHARLRIAKADKACYEAGLEVLYSDTDSIKVTGDPEVAAALFEKMNEDIRKDFNFSGLGLWVNETDGYTTGVFRGLKFYILENDLGERKASIAGTKPSEASTYVDDYSMEELADREVKTVIPITRRAPGKIENHAFGFSRVYALVELSIDYSKGE